MGGGSGRSGFIERGGYCEVTDRKKKREREKKLTSRVVGIIILEKVGTELGRNAGT